MLVKNIQSKKKSWSVFLDSCVFVYNISCHESTRFTPFELMFGRCATLPTDVSIGERLPEDMFVHHDCPNESNVLERVENKMKLLEEAKKNILCAQEKRLQSKACKPSSFHFRPVSSKERF